MWLLILLILTIQAQAQVTKIDDDTFSEVHNVEVSDLKAKIESIAKEESEWRRGIAELQSKIDSDDLRLKNIQIKIDSAASVGVADAIPLSTDAKPEDATLVVEEP